MKEIIDIVHKSILPFFDVCENEEEPLSDKDKLLLKVNKAICNNLKALEQEPRKGHWNCGDDMFEYAICSSCKHETGEAWEYAKRNFKYCPNCGAKMERSDKE